MAVIKDCLAKDMICVCTWWPKSRKNSLKCAHGMPHTLTRPCSKLGCLTFPSEPTKGGINSIGKNEQTTFCNPQENETLKSYQESWYFYSVLQPSSHHQVSQPRHPSFCARWQLGRHQPHMQWYQISDISVPADLERRKTCCHLNLTQASR